MAQICLNHAFKITQNRAIHRFQYGYFVYIKIMKYAYNTSQLYDPDVAPLEINVAEIVHLLAKEEELVAARTKAENLEKENVDLATELAKKVTHTVITFKAFIHG